MTYAYTLTAPSPAPDAPITEVEVLRLPSEALAQGLLARAYDAAYLRYLVATKQDLATVPVAMLLCWWKRVSPSTYPTVGVKRSAVDLSVWTLMQQQALRLRLRGGATAPTHPAHTVHTGAPA